MSYNYITKHTSPNATPYSQVLRTYGRPRTFEAIAIHWWGDPRNNPSFQGIVNYLCSPSAGVSAHFVATGTGRNVAQLVNLSDASWATNLANPFTVSIECDPRARSSDYDVVAEVISQIWDAYGYMPLVPHNKYVATACPGVYDLKRLEKLAKTKDGSGKWGVVKNKSTPAPKPTPKPTPKPKITYKKINKKTVELIRDAHLWNFNFDNWDKAKPAPGGKYKKGHKVEVVAEATNAVGGKYYMTAYSYNDGKVKATNGFNVKDTKDYVAPKPKPEPKPPVEEPTPEPPKDEKKEAALASFLQAAREWFEKFWNAKY